MLYTSVAVKCHGTYGVAFDPCCSRKKGYGLPFGRLPAGIMKGFSNRVDPRIGNLNDSEELAVVIQEIKDINAFENSVVWTIDTSSFLTIVCCK